MLAHHLCAITQATVPQVTGTEILFGAVFVYAVLVCPALLFLHASVCKGSWREMSLTGLRLVGSVFLGMVFHIIARGTLSYIAMSPSIRPLSLVISIFLMIAIPGCFIWQRVSAQQRAVQMQRLFMALAAVVALLPGWSVIMHAEENNWAVEAFPYYAVGLSNLLSVGSLVAASITHRVATRWALKSGYARALVTVQRRVLRLMPVLYGGSFLLLWGLLFLWGILFHVVK